MPWNKDSDWVNIEQAKAQLKFYQGDLESSLKYLVYVKTFANQKWKGYDKQLKIAQKDIEDSKKNLVKAQAKLLETQNRR